jgi:ribosomal protein L11 methyltransferase
MSWIEIRAKFETLPADLSPILEIFRYHGIENTQESGQEISGCLTNTEASTGVAESLSDALRAEGADVSVGDFEEQDWDEVWRQYFQPRRIGERFVIRPTWKEFEVGPNDLEIVLDPGQAFGTGDHPTTRLCIELLEQANVPGRSVADVGCGSGVLSIAAAKLGASRVIGSDIDPVAVEVALENAELNGLVIPFLTAEGVRGVIDPTLGEPARGSQEWEQDEVPLSQRPLIPPPAPQLKPTFDVAVSNIISAILIRIAADVRAILNPGGQWITSGIIEQNWPDVLEAAEGSGFRLREIRREDGWVAAIFDGPL